MATSGQILMTTAETGVATRHGRVANENAQPDGSNGPNADWVLFNWLKRQATTDMRHWNGWRRRVRTYYDMVANKQWTADEKAAYEWEGRVPVEFNWVLSVIKSVGGHEINNRHEVTFFPRGVEDTEANEVLNAASDWMADLCEAEDEESDAFEDVAICGMGWTEHRMGYDEDPSGMYYEERVDPLEMYGDKSAKRKNLVDARRIHRVRRDIDIVEARRMFPGFPDSELNASWVLSESDVAEPIPIEIRRLHRSGTTDGEDFNDFAMVTIVETQWFELRNEYLVAVERGEGPQAVEPQPEPVKLTESEYETFKERAQILGIQYRAAEIPQRVYYRAFLGATKILRKDEAPMGGRFTYTCITGERDRTEGTWFGLMAVMHDPQKYANKWITNTLAILSSTTNGGVLAEKGAFDDPRQAEDTWAQPDQFTWAAKDAIKDGRIQPKPTSGFPNGYFDMTQFAMGAVKQTVGITPEMLGQVDRNQPGILEAQRKQASVTILAGMFNNLRRFRKRVGETRLFVIQNYLSDGRIIRVAGPGTDPRIVRLVKEDTTGTYDVVIDESASGVNQKAETWAMIRDLLPVFGPLMTPEILLTALKYSPLPSSLIKALEAMLMPKDEEQQPDPAVEQQQQLLMQRLMAAIEADRAKAEKDKASAAKYAADAGKTVAETRKIGTPADPDVQNLVAAAGEAIGAMGGAMGGAPAGMMPGGFGG